MKTIFNTDLIAISGAVIAIAGLTLLGIAALTSTLSGAPLWASIVSTTPAASLFLILGAVAILASVAIDALTMGARIDAIILKAKREANR